MSKKYLQRHILTIHTVYVYTYIYVYVYTHTGKGRQYFDSTLEHHMTKTSSKKKCHKDSCSTCTATIVVPRLINHGNILLGKFVVVFCLSCCDERKCFYLKGLNHRGVVYDQSYNHIVT